MEHAKEMHLDRTAWRIFWHGHLPEGDVPKGNEASEIDRYNSIQSAPYRKCHYLNKERKIHTTVAKEMLFYQEPKIAVELSHGQGHTYLL